MNKRATILPTTVAATLLTTSCATPSADWSFEQVAQPVKSLTNTLPSRTSYEVNWVDVSGGLTPWKALAILAGGALWIYLYNKSDDDSSSNWWSDWCREKDEDWLCVD